MTFIVSSATANSGGLKTMSTALASSPISAAPRSRQGQQPITMTHQASGRRSFSTATSSSSHKFFLLICLFLIITPVLCAAGFSGSSGSLAAQVFASPRKNPFSPNAISRVRRRSSGSGGIAPKVEGSFGETTEADCVALGLEKCGDVCVAQCCSQEAALACPVNSYCTSNGEYDFCCRNGHTCDEPISCLSFDDPKCDGNAGEVVEGGDDEAKACCYKGFEICTTIWGGFPACMPTGTVEVPPKPTKHFHSKTGSYNPTFHYSTTGAPVATRVGVDPQLITPAPTPLADHQDKKDNEKNGDGDNDEEGEGDEDDEDAHINYSGVGGIVGGVIGGVIGLAILGTAVFFISRHYRHKWKEAQRLQEEEEEDALSVGGSSASSSRRSPNGSSRGGVAGGCTKKYWVSAEEDDSPAMRASTAQTSPSSSNFWTQYSMNGYGPGTAEGLHKASQVREKGKEPMYDDVHVDVVGGEVGVKPSLQGVAMVVPEPAQPVTEKSGSRESDGDAVVAIVDDQPNHPRTPTEGDKGTGVTGVAGVVGGGGALRVPPPVYLASDHHHHQHDSDSDHEPVPLTPPRSPRIGPIRTITMTSMSGAL
ncbi:hypothetical protein DFH27DRAFT_12541 [Peziza echinospora]|nr:hypothetical protein DFH27DRAFT_12541 [Peziza echinospora]